MSVSNAVRALTVSESWYVVNDFDITTLVWSDADVSVPTNAAIVAELEVQRIAKLSADYKSCRVKGKYELIMVGDEPSGRRLVSAGYPTIGDQLDALFKAGVFPADMAAQIQAVKDANPKP